jgi:site-specific DNA recombinase
MRDGQKRELRCAIYTRKSSEEGLEQDFNSLHAQREACEAFIKSQKHEGWSALPTVYDDGGYSGGSMERPALRQLLDDIRAKRVDVVVVYKVDRLTRSLADFAKIVEVFDAHGVSFVSVTQAFNTTSSMGRLTLNVLLSFAQFEREVTGERIRDKIAASKKKGLWMGGFVPFGYRPHDRTLIINEEEAATVRAIFQLYRELGSVTTLQSELAERNIQTRPFTSASNKEWGNRPFSRGHLYKMLSNPIYAGKIAHKGEQYEGQHEAIIPQETWDAVQQQLASNCRNTKSGARAKDPSLLAGLLVDGDSAHLTCSHTVKDGKRYRYYVTAPSGREKQRLRLPAHDIETTILTELRDFLGDAERLTDALSPWSLDAHELKEALRAAEELRDQLTHASVKRATLTKLLKLVRFTEAELTIEVQLAPLLPEGTEPGLTYELRVLLSFRRRSGENILVVAGSANGDEITDPALVKSIARGFAWFEELAEGRSESAAAIAKREGVTDRYVSQLIDLALLSPRIVEQSLNGGQTIRLSTKQLVLETELDPVWRVQEQQVFA